ncbi:MAG TPA: hypothetical protein VF867_04265, partial [Arthrobacter sp.]
MAIPTRQPQGIPAGGQFAPDTRSEPTINLSPDGDKAHTAPLTGTVELRNAGFDQLPPWPAGMPQPEVSFGFSNGKCETSITVDGRLMSFWDSDTDGTINDTDNGSNPWEDFDEEDQEIALHWGKRVHQRIDGSTYGIMIEASNTPAVHAIIMAHALGEDPTPEPDFTDKDTREDYIEAAQDRVYRAQRELQQVYLIAAAQELREKHPEIDSFDFSNNGDEPWMDAAWDVDGKQIEQDKLDAANHDVFRYR